MKMADLPPPLPTEHVLIYHRRRKVQNIGGGGASFSLSEI